MFYQFFDRESVYPFMISRLIHNMDLFKANVSSYINIIHFDSRDNVNQLKDVEDLDVILFIVKSDQIRTDIQVKKLLRVEHIDENDFSVWEFKNSFVRSEWNFVFDKQLKICDNSK